MASAACAKTVRMSSEKFLDCSPTFGLLYDNPAIIAKKPRSPPPSSAAENQVSPPSPEMKDIEVSRNDMGDFEFRLLEDPVAMLPADELFSDGKLLPLRFGEIRIDDSFSSSSDLVAVPTMENISSSSSSVVLDRRFESSDLYLFSPKAPRCSSRLREILGLKKIQSFSNNSSSSSSKDVLQKNHKYLMKYFLHRNQNNNKSSSDHLPLLKEEMESRELVSSSSARLSLSSSSSSGFDHEDLPRLSLDSDRLNNNPPPKIQIRPGRSKTSKNPNPNVIRTRKGDRGVSLDWNSSSSTTTTSSTTDHRNSNNNRIGRSPTRRAETNSSSECTRIRAFSVDSPRMNSSGKVVFHNLGRSSSSPSSFNGGQQTKIKPRGMERSYSSNVMVTPVLNVPVCSLRGSSKSGSVFGLFPTSSSSSSQRRSDGHHHNHSSSSSIRDQMKRNRTDHRVC